MTSIYKTLLFLSVFLFCINIISAIDMRIYGDNYNNAQTFLVSGNGNLEPSSLYNLSLNYGYDVIANSGTRYQPIVYQYNNSEYLIFPYGTYLQVYNYNFVLMNEFYSRTALSQIELVDFDLDGNPHEIEGVFALNSTTASFDVMQIDFSTFSLSRIYQYNFSMSNDGNISGVRLGRFLVTHSLLSGKWKNDFYAIQNYSVVSFSLPNLSQSSKFLEPPSTMDINGDSILENVMYNVNSVWVFTDSGNILLNKNYSSGTVQQALFFSPDGSSIKKLAVVDGLGIHVVRATDGTSVWDYNLSAGGGNRFTRIGINNYGSQPSVYYATTQQATNNRYFYIFRGYDGVISENHNDTGFRIDNMFLADMNKDGYADMILSNKTDFYIYSISGDFIVLNRTPLGFSSYSCIPVDFTFDASLDIMCSSSAKTLLFASSIINNNSYITSLTFDPSTTIQEGNTLYVTSYASDIDLDTIYYSYRCNSTDSFIEGGTSNLASCTYDYIGSYEFTSRVRDSYHVDYDAYSQTILVTSTGISCNNNNVCEEGETASNCPLDCSIVSNNTFVSQYGGSNIPLELVNIEDENKGLLPEIYFGTLAFFSGSAIPLMIIIFTFLSVLIILALFSLIGRLVTRF